MYLLHFFKKVYFVIYPVTLRKKVLDQLYFFSSLTKVRTWHATLEAQAKNFPIIIRASHDSLP